MMFVDMAAAYGDNEFNVIGFSRGAIAATELSMRVAEKYPNMEINFVGRVATIPGTPGIVVRQHKNRQLDSRSGDTHRFNLTARTENPAFSLPGDTLPGAKTSRAFPILLPIA